MRIVDRVWKWTLASYAPLNLRQWLAGFGLGQAIGWVLVLQFAAGWPVWQQGLAATELAFASLTVTGWTLRRFGVGSHARGGSGSTLGRGGL